MGQYDLSSNLYDTFHFTGASLESDESMLPPDLQGYAPQITGIAQTNAKVTVAQNGRVLYQTTVAPGPFTISDLGQSFQGQLDVTVEEEDGRTSTFQVGSASIPYLTRKGQVRYKTSLGKPTSVGHNDINNPFFWTAEAFLGLVEAMCRCMVAACSPLMIIRLSLPVLALILTNSVRFYF